MGELKKIKKKNQPILLGGIATVLGLGLIGACANGQEESAKTSASTVTMTTVVPSAPSPSPVIAAPAPAAPSADCTPAPQDLVDQVNAHLAPSGQTLADTFVVVSPEGYQYVGGNIMEGETKNSSADVWIAQDDWVLYALSGSARDETPQLADGRTLGLSAVKREWTMTKTLITAMAVLGIALGTAGTASASEDAFIDAIEQQGHYATGAPGTSEEALAIGYDVCRIFTNGGEDQQAIDWVLSRYNGDDSPDREYYATLFVQSATYELCPQHDGQIGPI